MNEVTRSFKTWISDSMIEIVDHPIMISQVAYNRETKQIAVLVLGPSAADSRLVAYEYIRSDHPGTRKHQFVNGSIESVSPIDYEILREHMNNGNHDVLEFDGFKTVIKEQLTAARDIITTITVIDEGNSAVDEHGQLYTRLTNIYRDRIGLYKQFIAQYTGDEVFAISEEAYSSKGDLLPDMVGLYAAHLSTEMTVFWQLFKAYKDNHGK